jgi:hypothetical protein
MVGSHSSGKLPTTNLITIDDFPTPISPILGENKEIVRIQHEYFDLYFWNRVEHY